MNIAVLPFNAGPNTRAPLARQFANFAADMARSHAEADANAIHYLAQIAPEGAPRRFAMINPSEALNEREMLNQVFKEAGCDRLVDGLLVTGDNGELDLTYRVFENGTDEPILQKSKKVTNGDAFPVLRELISDIASLDDKKLPSSVDADEQLFGTDNPEAFFNFLEGYDALQYIDRSQGQVVPEFQPKLAMDALVSAMESDLDWEGPFVGLVQLCRLCTQYRVGAAEDIEQTLKKLVEMYEDDARPMFALGEYYEAVGDHAKAADWFEKAHVKDPNEVAILNRLGMSQLNLNMPVNAERNFRKSLELQPTDVSARDLLANVLIQTSRAHEVPALWRELVEKNPQDGQSRAKLALALIQAGQDDDAIKVFEDGLNELEENSVIKRFYAPYLAQKKQDFDRAMDYYEDCIELAPNDIPLLIEYAQTLQAGGREFEVPKILRDILGANPDANTRAQVLAWQIELEQPKRVEIVMNAQKKMESEDFAGAISDLNSVKNWMGDYWKMWALLSAAYNRNGEPAEAEESARRLLGLFPACEPGFAELAAALGAQEKHEEAYQTMQFAAMTIPNSLPIVMNLALAAKRAGRADEARSIARQVREAVGQNEELAPFFAEIEN